MIYAFIRLWATIFLRLYFRKTIIYGLENVPRKGPLILASNHPSAFLEASILSTVMKRPIHFLVRGDMFHPKFHWLFNWTKQIPIYRKKDGIANLRKNASSFDLTYKKLSEGESVLIFPEAKTVLEKKMRPIQKGTAHLAFGTTQYLKDDEQLAVQPVGVNFTEPRMPGTDVVIKFGLPFYSQKASREDRDEIENFTEVLSDAMSPLIIQVDEEIEKNYDLLAAIYFRMIYDNKEAADAYRDIQRIANVVNQRETANIFLAESTNVLNILSQKGIKDAILFPDLIVLNKMGLFMMSLLKIVWLAGGGWIWRVVRNTIFKKIKTNTFQSPTTVGVFMVVMPLVTIILLVILLILSISGLFVFLWLLLMITGTLIRPPFRIITGLFMMDGKLKKQLKEQILDLRKNLDSVLNSSSSHS